MGAMRDRGEGARVFAMMDARASVPPVHERRYRAFISYSHADERAAGRLHRWLETYRIPARLVGTESARGRVERRMVPIFRDRAELPAATSLGAEVQKALAASDALLVLCSPSAARSRWVDAEIALFRELHPDRPIIAAILDGDPAECFPPSLLVTDAQGEVHEPIAADFRSEQDGPKLARLKIVAGLTGLALDQIIQRDAQRQLRRVIAITLLALVMTLSMALMLVFAIQAQREADHQRRQAEGLIEFMLTDLRQRLNGVGRLDVLDTVNQRAFAYYADQSDLDDLPVDSLERRARVLHAMGEDDQRRGEYDRSLSEFHEAERVTGTLLAADPEDPERIFNHAQSEFWLGYVVFARRHYAEAMPRFEAYLRLARRLVELEPGNEKYLRELAYAQGNICSVAVSLDKHDKRLAECGHALATMERVHAMLPEDAGVEADLANRHSWYADALRLQKRYKKALAERRLQTGIARRMLARDPRNVAYEQNLMLARYSTAVLLDEMGEAEKAQTLLAQASSKLDALIAADPENMDWRKWRARFDEPLND